MPRSVEFITEFLDSRESAPSALCMVKSIHLGRELTDAEMSECYENGSESDLDSQRNYIISIMSNEQLLELHELALEIMLEKLAEAEESIP